MKKNIILLVLVLLLGIAAWFVFNKKSGTLANQPLSDFAIEDTASITKIIITDHLGGVAKVERIPGNKLWKLNDTYFAREDAVETLLKTFKRIRVRGNVSDPARDNLMKLLATSGKRAEIFMGGEKPAKVYYVGVPTPDHTGTVMLLEIPGKGRSQEPYITHMEGFTGFLSTRFFTDEKEWRYTGVYDYPNLEFSSVRILNSNNPTASFEVKYKGGNEIELFGDYDQDEKTFKTKIENFDTLEVKDLLLSFKKLHLESFNPGLSDAALDSLNASTPAFSIVVRDNKGEVKQTDLFLKPATAEQYEESGARAVWDNARFWARTPDGEFGVAQAFNFGPVVLPLSTYKAK